MEGPPLPAASASEAPTGPAPAKSGNALKVVLIVLAVIFVLGMTLVGGLIYMGKRMVDRAIQTSEDGRSTKVETPFGKFESSEDPKAVMEKLGIEAFPEATPVLEGTNSATIGQLEVSNAQFRTNATVNDVVEFYRGKYPDMQLMDLGDSKMLSMGEREKNQVVITVTRDESAGDTSIHLSKTAKRQ